MRKYIITAELRELEWKVSKGEISYSRMIEILCEKADEYAKMYHEQELSKLRQDAVSGRSEQLVCPNCGSSEDKHRRVGEHANCGDCGYEWNWG